MLYDLRILFKETRGYRAVASGASEGGGGTCVNMDSTKCCRRGRAAAE